MDYFLMKHSVEFNCLLFLSLMLFVTVFFVFFSIFCAYYMFEIVLHL